MQEYFMVQYNNNKKNNFFCMNFLIHFSHPQAHLDLCRKKKSYDAATFPFHERQEKKAVFSSSRCGGYRRSEQTESCARSRFPLAVPVLLSSKYQLPTRVLSG